MRAIILSRTDGTNVANRAHARDHRGNLGRAEHVAQRDPGYLLQRHAEVRGERVDVLLDPGRPVTAEVPVAEVALREAGPSPDPAGQPALVQRHPDDDPDAVLGAGGAAR